MPDQSKQAWDGLIETLRSAMRKSRRETINRHTKVTPNIDPRRIDEIVIGQMTEHLRHLADEAERKEEYDQRNLWEALIECLPELKHWTYRRKGASVRPRPATPGLPR